MSSARNHMKRSHRSESVKRNMAAAQHIRSYLRPDQVKRRDAQSPLARMLAAMRGAVGKHALGRRKPREKRGAQDVPNVSNDETT